MRPPRTARGRVYIRRVRSTWMATVNGRDIHVASVRPEVAAGILDRDEHRSTEMTAALAHQRVLNNRNRNRRNKRHG